jgi:ketosteroid isomerase-like protein
MRSDEERIRELVSRWMVATKSGGVDAVLELMTDDAVAAGSRRQLAHACVA